MQPPKQHAPGNDTQHDTQEPSTPPHPNPQQITMQIPEQPAPLAPAMRRAPTAPAPIPERFKQKVDYKFDGLCCMRHLKRVIYFNTVNRSLIMSIPHLIQLQR